MSIKLINITKRFGRKVVFENINLEVAKGECFCLLGRNGAGKSTLINILSDMLRPDTGSVTIDNLSYEKNERKIKEQLGVLPEQNPAINELTGFQYLKFVGLLYNLGVAEITKRSNSLISYFLETEADGYKPISIYSQGMKQKIALCAALIHQPSYLLLDEPFTGLDPVSSARLVKFINSYLAKGVAILLSSHSLDYVEQVATHVGVLDEGSLKFEGTLDDFTAHARIDLEASLLKLLQPVPKDMQKLEWLL